MLFRRRWPLLALLVIADLLLLAVAGWWIYQEAQPAATPGAASPAATGTAIPDGEVAEPDISDAGSEAAELLEAEALELELLQTLTVSEALTNSAPLPSAAPAVGLPGPPAAPATRMVLPNMGCVITATGGLITEFKAISEAMPRAGSQGMLVPTLEQMAAWEALVRFSLGGDLPAACALIQANGFPYHLVRFTDLPYNKERYLILKEDLPVTVGWGTYVFRQNPKVAPLVVEVPHPREDGRTNLEGVEIFRKVNARALLMAGAHRCSNAAASGCSGQTEACGGLGPYRNSDVAHSAQSMFQAAHRALVTCGGEMVALQLHGNSLTGCPDLFIGNGTLAPGELSHDIYIQAKEFCTGYSIDLADNLQPECLFSGGTIVQAVATNGCSLEPRPDACTGSVRRPGKPEQFILLEQSLALRKDYDCLIEALKATFP